MTRIIFLYSLFSVVKVTLSTKENAMQTIKAGRFVLGLCLAAMISCCLSGCDDRPDNPSVPQAETIEPMIEQAPAKQDQKLAKTKRTLDELADMYPERKQEFDELYARILDIVVAMEKFQRTMDVDPDGANEMRIGTGPLPLVFHEQELDELFVKAIVERESRRHTEEFDPNEANRAARRMLQRKIVRVEFDEIPLEKAIQWLRDEMNAGMTVHWYALDAIGVARDTPVTLHLRNTKSETVLKQLLSMFDTEEDSAMYVMENGRIVISTRSDLDKSAESK